MRRLIFFFLLGIIVSCSSERDTVRLVNQAEKIVREHPAQALQMLDTLSREDFRSRREKARYGIVKSMALTKNWIEPSSDSLIRPAVDYYGKSRQHKYRMLAWYYLGRVQSKQEELVPSLYSFKKAEDAAENTGDDQYKGLIQMGLANVCTRNYNSPEALKYVKKALRRGLVRLFIGYPGCRKKHHKKKSVGLCAFVHTPSGTQTGESKGTVVESIAGLSGRACRN